MVNVPVDEKFIEPSEGVKSSVICRILEEELVTEVPDFAPK